MAVSFTGNVTTREFFPKFQRNVNSYVLKPLEDDTTSEIRDIKVNGLTLSEIARTAQLGGSFNTNNLMNTVLDWEQLCWFRLYVHNNGETVIEDYKIELEFEGYFVEVGTESPSIFLKNFKSNVKEYSNSKKDLWIKPFEKTLVQGDGFLTNDIYIEPTIGLPAKINLKWKLLSRDYNCEGVLLIVISPQYHTVKNIQYVFNEEQVRITENISLVKRKGISNFNGKNYFDKETDYTFE